MHFAILMFMQLDSLVVQHIMHAKINSCYFSCWRRVAQGVGVLKLLSPSVSLATLRSQAETIARTTCPTARDDSYRRLWERWPFSASLCPATKRQKLLSGRCFGALILYIYIYMYVYIYIYIYIYIHTYLSLSLCMYLSISLSLYIYIYICVCVCIYIYIYISESLSSHLSSSAEEGFIFTGTGRMCEYVDKVVTFWPSRHTCIFHRGVTHSSNHFHPILPIAPFRGCLSRIRKPEWERILYIYTPVYIYIYVFMYVCMYIYIYVCMYVRMYVCVYIHIIYVYVCIYIYIHIIYIYIYTYSCIYISLSLSISLSIYIYIHIHTYIHRRDASQYSCSWHVRSHDAVI